MRRPARNTGGRGAAYRKTIEVEESSWPAWTTALGLANVKVCYAVFKKKTSNDRNHT